MGGGWPGLRAPLGRTARAGKIRSPSPLHAFGRPTRRLDFRRFCRRSAGLGSWRCLQSLYDIRDELEIGAGANPHNKAGNFDFDRRDECCRFRAATRRIRDGDPRARGQGQVSRQRGPSPQIETLTTDLVLARNLGHIGAGVTALPERPGSWLPSSNYVAGAAPHHENRFSITPQPCLMWFPSCPCFNPSPASLIGFTSVSCKADPGKRRTLAFARRRPMSERGVGRARHEDILGGPQVSQNWKRSPAMGSTEVWKR